MFVVNGRCCLSPQADVQESTIGHDSQPPGCGRDPSHAANHWWDCNFFARASDESATARNPVLGVREARSFDWGLGGDSRSFDGLCLEGLASPDSHSAGCRPCPQPLVHPLAGRLIPNSQAQNPFGVYFSHEGREAIVDSCRAIQNAPELVFSSNLCLS